MGIQKKERKKVKSLSRVQLFVTPWTVAYHAPLSMEFSRQEYWSGLPFPSPEDLTNPGIEAGSPTLYTDTSPSEPLRKSVWKRAAYNFLVTIIRVNVYMHAQSYLTLCDQMDCSLPESSVHGISQARILEWVAISFSWGFSQPRASPGLQGDFLSLVPPGKPQLMII